MQPHDHLGRAGHHFLDQERIGPTSGVALDIGGHPPQALRHVLRRDIDGHAAHIAFVRDFAGQELQHHAWPQRRGGLCGLILGADHDLPDAGDAESGKKRLGPGFIQRAAFRASHRNGLRGLLSAALGKQAARVHLPHRRQGGADALGRVERRYAVAAEDFRSPGCMWADVGHHGFVARRQRVLQRSRHQLGLRHAGRTDDHDERVVAVAFQHDANRAAQQFGLQARQGHIDGIAVQRRMAARLQRAQGLSGGCVRQRQFETGDAQAIRHQRAGSARRSQDRDAAPA
ncbi:hypothetical protein D3C85_739640 [compost metagenome]